MPCRYVVPYRHNMPIYTDEELRTLTKKCSECGKTKYLKDMNKERRDRAYGGFYYRRCTHCASRHVRAYNLQTRIRLMAQLCGGEDKICCQECGFSDMRALEFDHIDNDGYKDRKYGQRVEIQKAVRENPERFQVLCSNCNQIKRFEHAKQEHKEREDRAYDLAI